MRYVLLALLAFLLSGCPCTDCSARLGAARAACSAHEGLLTYSIVYGIDIMQLDVWCGDGTRTHAIVQQDE